jgi:hypothetical protein
VGELTDRGWLHKRRYGGSAPDCELKFLELKTVLYIILITNIALRFIMRAPNHPS